MGAALDEFQENGIDAVSFRGVSRRLGVNPMALYTYVADKDELLAAVFDHVVAGLGELFPPEAGDPKQELTAFYTAVFRLMVEYTDLARLVRPAIVGTDLDLAERVYRMLADLGVAKARIADVHLALLDLTIGSAITAGVRVPSANEADAGPDHPLLSAVLRRFDELDAEDHFAGAFALVLDALVTPEPPR